MYVYFSNYYTHIIWCKVVKALLRPRSSFTLVCLFLANLHMKSSVKVDELMSYFVEQKPLFCLIVPIHEFDEILTAY